MNINDNIEKFFNKIKLESLEDFNTSIKEITKKLNKNYYDNDSDEDNSYLVGSIGRGTAVKGVSDIDLIFCLPNEIYDKFNAYKSKGQSSLLQEVKDILKERYTNTDISADGQVVVIAFNKFTIELVPVFLEDDNTFKYPDTNDGGSWKITKPIQEQEASFSIDKDYNGLFVKLSNMLRCWKNNVGFKFGGLLIDTLVYNFLVENTNYKNFSIEDYSKIIEDMFRFLKKQNSDQEYWLALGSNQHVYNSDNGKFVKKSEKAFNKLKNCNNDTELEDAYIELFGNKFSSAIAESRLSEERKYASIYKNINYNEAFIDNLFPVYIMNTVKIECDVKQDGYRITPLKILLEKGFLKPEKQLKFFIVKCDVVGEYDIYWKVRNCGEEAYRRNDIRGQIVRDDGSKSKIEHSKFRGNHYVECYIIKSGICIAKDRIDVPIIN